MKKALSLILVLAMVLCLVACGSGSSTTETKAPAENKSEAPAETKAPEASKKLIAGIVFQEDQFFKTLAAGYAAAAKDLGYELLQANTNNDQSKETETLSTYAAQGVLGTVVSPLNTQTSPAAVEDAYNSGMQIAICNAAIDAFPYAVGSYSADNFSFCKQTGENAVKFIQEHYDAEKTLKVGVVQFKTQVPEQSADRVNGFFSALDDVGIKYEIVADIDAWLQDMAVAKAGDMISANPDLDIIYAANDGGTVGSVMAVENAGKAGEMFVFGTDGSEQIVSLLKSENNILQAVTAQDAFAIGYNAVTALVNALEGKDFEGKGQTNIVPGIPLTRGDDAGLDAYLADMQALMG